MAKKVKTAVLVVLLTGLIWAWAEQSQTATLEDKPITLRIQLPADSGMAICTVDGRSGWSDSVSIPLVATFVGHQSGISELDRVIRSRKGDYPPPYVLPVADESRDRVELDVAAVLNSQPILSAQHTTVSAVAPAFVTLRLSRLRSYPVKVAPEFNRLVSGSINCLPESVQLRLPPQLYDELTDKTWRPMVQLDPATDLAKPFEIDLPARFEGFPVAPDPSRVTVNVDVGIDELPALENVPVQVMYPPEFPLDEVKLVADDRAQWRKTIRVRGPRDKPLTADDVEVYLKVRMDDVKPADQLFRDVEIRLPAGYELISPLKGGPERRILFKFVRRGESGPVPPP